MNKLSSLKISRNFLLIHKTFSIIFNRLWSFAPSNDTREQQIYQNNECLDLNSKDL